MTDSSINILYQMMCMWTFGKASCSTVMQKIVLIFFFFKETEDLRILFHFTKIYVEHCHPTAKSDNKINESLQLFLRHGLCKVFC